MIMRRAGRSRSYLRYDGELTGGTTSHLVSAGVRIVW